GYIGGKTDLALMRFTDLVIQLPRLPLMLILVVFWGRGLLVLIFVIGILGWTGTARIVRAETLSLKKRPFIEATRAIGARDVHIIFVHILPNVFPVIFAIAILGIVDSILSEAALSFLGFGDPSEPSWGMVLNEAQTHAALLTGRWWWFIPPGLCILVFVFGFALMSHSLNQLINPRLRERE
ncbi:MAG: ABC transporter permease, partial [Candidatus Hodarchaeota archaeon]